MSAIILDGDIVHYEVLGRGRPLFYLHGWVGSWRYWIPAMQTTSVSFRSYALDLWGFGASAHRSAGYAIDGQMGMLDSFMTEMGIGKIALVGHGLGAAAALRFAQKYPRAVDRLLLVSLPLGPTGISARFNEDSPEALADWLLGREPGLEAVWSETEKTDPQAVRKSLSDLQTLGAPALSLSLTTPTLLVYGRTDPAIPHPEQRVLDGLPEHIHQITFEESAHFPMLDETNKFNRLLRDFLALESGESPRKLQLKEEWKRRVR